MFFDERETLKAELKDAAGHSTCARRAGGEAEEEWRGCVIVYVGCSIS